MKKRVLALALAAAMMVGVLTSCGSSGSGGGSASGGNSSDGALNITWGAGTLGGTIQLLSTACASVIQDKIPGSTVTVQATGGSIENCRLLASGDLDVGHTTQMYDAYVGQGPFADDGPNDKILALMNLYNVESIAIVKADSKIQSLEDLAGKRVVLGPTGSGIASMATAMMTAYGYDSSNCDMLNLANDQAVDALKDGTVDMIWGFASAKTPASYLESLYTTTECPAPGP